MVHAALKKGLTAEPEPEFNPGEHNGRSEASSDACFSDASVDFAH
jgi:hypothetical protein